MRMRINSTRQSSVGPAPRRATSAGRGRGGGGGGGRVHHLSFRVTSDCCFLPCLYLAEAEKCYYLVDGHRAAKDCHACLHVFFTKLHHSVTRSGTKDISNGMRTAGTLAGRAAGFLFQARSAAYKYAQEAQLLEVNHAPASPRGSAAPTCTGRENSCARCPLRFPFWLQACLCFVSREFFRVNFGIRQRLGRGGGGARGLLGGCGGGVITTSALVPAVATPFSSTSFPSSTPPHPPPPPPPPPQAPPSTSPNYAWSW